MSMRRDQLLCVLQLRRCEPRRPGYPDILLLMSKVLVSLDEKLLARIDRAARSAGLSRSAYLARLAQRDLGESRGPGARRQARRAIRRLQVLFDAHPTDEDATAAVRSDRGTH